MTYMRHTSLEIRGCPQHRWPVLLSSPHSGTLFPDGFLKGVMLDSDRLRPLGDGPIDRLLDFADDAGVQIVCGRYNRAVIDLNRAPEELEPGLLAAPGSHRLNVTPRVRAGLGLIPTRIGGCAIYRRRLPDDELAWRRQTIHAPFHETIESILNRLSRRFGEALLLDCHSMPTCAAVCDGQRIDMVLGDRHGRTALPTLVTTAKAVLEARGFRVTLNHPYAGGYVTERHGRPAAGRSAIQVEIRRDLFMDEQSHVLHEGAGRVREALRALVHSTGSAIGAHGRANAA